MWSKKGMLIEKKQTVEWSHYGYDYVIEGNDTEYFIWSMNNLNINKNIGN